MERLSRALSMLLILFHFAWARWRWHYLRGRRLRRWQETRARRAVAYARQRSPFYREHWRGHEPTHWRTLPTVDKRLMMDNFDLFNTRGVGREEALEVALRAERSRDFAPTLNGLTVGLSSGTSGHRGMFLADAWEQAAWAGNILSRTLHDIRPRRLRVAFFLRSNSNLYEKVGGLLVQFRFFDLMLPLEKAVTSLNDFGPDIVVGPPSLLGFLADARQEGRLGIRPERLVSVAEVLEPQDRQRLETVFGVPVHEIYQCTEGLLAVSCERGSLHIQEDLAVLQLEPLPGGDRKRVTPVVTDLWRRTQPIIRYALNDVLQMEEQICPCGSPFRVISAIEGRSDDVCYFSKPDGRLRPFFPDTIRRAILLASPDVLDYQAFQERPGHLRVHLSVAESAHFEVAANQVRDLIHDTVDQYGCMAQEVTILEGLEPSAPGAKRRRVVRLYPEPGAGPVEAPVVLPMPVAVSGKL